MNLPIVTLFLLLSCISPMSYQEFMTLSDDDIWSQPDPNGHFYFGYCAIVDSRTHSNVCDYYVKKNASNGEGLPDGIGSGCLKAPITSCPTCLKNVDVCWSSSNYNAYDGSWPICTSDHKKNGANMIRIGVLKGYCDVSNFTFTKTSPTNTTNTTVTTTTSNNTVVNGTCTCNCVFPTDLCPQPIVQPAKPEPKVAVVPTLDSKPVETTLGSMGLQFATLIMCSLTMVVILVDKVQRCCRVKKNQIKERNGTWREQTYDSSEVSKNFNDGSKQINEPTKDVIYDN